MPAHDADVASLEADAVVESVVGTVSGRLHQCLACADAGSADLH